MGKRKQVSGEMKNLRRIVIMRHDMVQELQIPM
jgi:hypothetical protein